MNAAVPGPRGFRPAGSVADVRWEPEGPFKRKRRLRGSRGRGVAYERKVLDELRTRYPGALVASPWFRYREQGSSEWHWCQPDALLVDAVERLVILVEVKLSHTVQAYWQTKLLYEPVLRWLFIPGAWSLATLEITRWYDPSVPFPFRPVMTPEPTQAPPDMFSVWIWDKRRTRA